MTAETRRRFCLGAGAGLLLLGCEIQRVRIVNPSDGVHERLRRLERLLSDREIKLRLTPESKNRLVDLGYEPQLGARPLRRAIVRELQNPLAEALLAGGYQGGATLEVGVKDDKFTFTKAT